MRLSETSLADTIVACATPAGEGAVAIVRLSGPRALELGALLAPGRRRRVSHVLTLSRVVGRDGALVDQALVVEMHAPRSFTGEDVVELHCHGSRAVVAEVLAQATALGARPARAGEFTLRAFLHGRLDLAQAEAVGELVSARDAISVQNANKQLTGALSSRVGELIDRCERVLAAWRAALDFPEHEVGDGITPQDRSDVDEIRCKVQLLLDSARTKAAAGAKVVLCGPPNVGKSSLLNAWLGEERVLVDAAPGTTRDPVEVELGDGRLRWSLWDTAGLRDGASALESRGIALTRSHARGADLVLWLTSADEPAWPPEELGARVVGSKSDLASVGPRADLEGEAAQRGCVFLGWVSAANGEGLVELRSRVERELLGDAAPDAEGLVVRERHRVALERALAALGEVSEGLGAGLTLDVLAATLEGATAALGEILGRDVDAEVLERVFADFCIGK